MPRPATRMGDVAILANGQTVILTPDEIAALERGEKVTVAYARGQHTPKVGELLRKKEVA